MVTEQRAPCCAIFTFSLAASSSSSYIHRKGEHLRRNFLREVADLCGLTLYHSIFGAGLPVMMAVNVAGWPGSTHRSSWGTWMVGGAEYDIRLVSALL